MKPIIEPTPAALARALSEIAALVVRQVRAELHRHHPLGLSYTQIRALSAVRSRPGTSLGEVAVFVGLGLPTASKVVDELVRQALVERRAAPEDRRRLELRITAEGAELLNRAVAPARASVAELLEPLDAEERAVVARALALLQPLLVPGERSEEGDGGE
jgi:DNA-binding MarR family transcriptional regulator